MLISLLALLIISNALTLRKDKSILFSRIVMVSLIHTSFLAYNNLFFLALDKGIGIFGGLFHVTVFTQIFNIFIFILSALILTLTSFYPRKVFLNQISSLSFLLFGKFNYNKTKISNKMAGQFRILEYSLIIVFVLSGVVFLMSASDFKYFIFILSHTTLIIGLMSKRNNKMDTTWWQNIKNFFNLPKEILIVVTAIFLISSLLIFILKFWILGLYPVSLLQFLYYCIVLFPLAVLTRLIIFNRIFTEYKNVRDFSFLVIEGYLNQCTVKSLFLCLCLALVSKLAVLISLSFYLSEAILCDGGTRSLEFLGKEVVIQDRRETIYVLPKEQEKILNDYNLVSHKNLKQIEACVNNLFPKVALLNTDPLNSAHFIGVLTPTVIPDYYNFLNGRMTNDYLFQNYKDFILTPSILEGNSKYNNAIGSGTLKWMIYQHNLVKENKNFQYSMPRAINLDYALYKEDIVNLIESVPQDIQRLHDILFVFKQELDVLDIALSEYYSGFKNGMFHFDCLAKRNQSYHGYMIMRVIEQHKYGLCLNRNVRFEDGKMVRELFTMGQHKNIIAALKLKFLIPQSNSFSFEVKDFSNPDQLYVEILENKLFSLLKIMLTYQQLQYLNLSEELETILTNNDISLVEKNDLIKIINSKLYELSVEHLDKYKFEYGQIDQYYHHRIMSDTNRGSIYNMLDVIDKKFHINVSRINSNLPLFGTQLTSSLGLNLARDYAYHSPFISWHSESETHVKHSSKYSYSYIASLVYNSKEVD